MRSVGWMAPVLALAIVNCTSDGGGSAATDTASSDTQPPDGDTADRDTTPPVFVSLIDHGAWVETPPSDDPLAAHRPDDAVCPDGAWFVEGDLLEVNTERCDYVSVEQNASLALPAGQRVGVTAWHGRLAAPDASEAHVALLIEDQVVWEYTVPIPHEGNFWTDEFTLPTALASGDRIRFHLHNHGANTWNLAYLDLVDPP